MATHLKGVLAIGGPIFVSTSVNSSEGFPDLDSSDLGYLKFWETISHCMPQVKKWSIKRKVVYVYLQFNNLIWKGPLSLLPKNDVLWKW